MSANKYFYYQDRVACMHASFLLGNALDAPSSVLLIVLLTTRLIDCMNTQHQATASHAAGVSLISLSLAVLAFAHVPPYWYVCVCL